VSHYRYLLGDAAREAARLRAQARLWEPVSLALFDRIGGGLIALHDGLRRYPLDLRRCPYDDPRAVR
jgi:hypothetical protein